MKKLFSILFLLVAWEMSFSQSSGIIRGGGGNVDSIDASKIKSGKIDTARLPILILNVKYPLQAKHSPDSLLLSQTWLDSLANIAALSATQIGFGSGSNKLSGTSVFTYVNNSILNNPGFNTGSYTYSFGMNGAAFQNSGSGILSGNFGLGSSTISLPSGSSGSVTNSFNIGTSNTITITGASSVDGDFISGSGNFMQNVSESFINGNNNSLRGVSRSALFGQNNYVTPLDLSVVAMFTTGVNLVAKSSHMQAWFGFKNDSTYANISSILLGVGNGFGGAISNAFWIDSLGNAYLHPGNTSKRPASPIAGTFRINSDSAFRIEVYDGSAWHASGTGGGAGGITALTGDVTASGSGSVAATLATVNSNVGTFGDATHVPQFTVNGKGLITGVTSVTITAGSAFSRQLFTSGSSGTVTGGNYIVTFDPSSVISSFTLALPTSPADKDLVEIEGGGTITGGNPVITLFTITGTKMEASPVTTLTAGEHIKYRYRASNTTWYREN
jgi:hypothetical protein